jgi:hypothetical protein
MFWEGEEKLDLNRMGMRSLVIPRGKVTMQLSIINSHFDSTTGFSEEI